VSSFRAHGQARHSRHFRHATGKGRTVDISRRREGSDSDVAPIDPMNSSTTIRSQSRNYGAPNVGALDAQSKNSAIRLHRITAPTLFIRGAQRRPRQPIFISIGYAKLIPNARVTNDRRGRTCAAALSSRKNSPASFSPFLRRDSTRRNAMKAWHFSEGRRPTPISPAVGVQNGSASACRTASTSGEGARFMDRFIEGVADRRRRRP